MPLPSNPYRVLGIHPGASVEDIQAAWRRLSRTYHPDRNASAEAAERFRAVQEAWAILADHESKARCDDDLRRLLVGDPEHELSTMIHDYLEGFTHVF